MPFVELPKLYHPDFADPRKKPAGAVEIDPRSRWGKHIVRAFVPQQSAVDLKLSSVLEKTGSVSVIAGNANFPGSSDFFSYPDSTPVADEITIICRFRRQNNGEHGGLYSDKNTLQWSSSQGVSFNHRDTDSRGLLLKVGASEVIPAAGTMSLSENVWYDAAATWKASDFARVYLNGSEPASYDSQSVAASFARSTANSRIGQYYDFRDHKGDIAYLFVLNKALTQREIVEFHNAAYFHTLKPAHPQQLFFGAGGGGVTLDASVSFGVSQGFSLTAQAASSAALIQAITAGKTVSSQASADGSHTATASAGTNHSAQLEASRGISVNVSAGADNTAQAEANGTHNAAVNAGSGVSAIAQVDATITPSLAAGFNTSAVAGSGAVVEAAVSFSTSLAANKTATADILGAITVTANAGATATAQADTAASIVVTQQMATNVIAEAAAQAGIIAAQVLGASFNGSTFTGDVITPEGRIYHISAEARTVIVGREDRTYTIQ